VDALLERARDRATAAGSDLVVSGAAEGAVFDLRGTREGRFQPFQPSSLVKRDSDLSEERILIAGVPSEERANLIAAAVADGIPFVTDVPLEALKWTIKNDHPSLILIGDEYDDPVGICAELRAQGAEAKDVPIIIVTDQQRASVEVGEEAGVTDWLTPPFSVQYARSRMRAWLMRSMFRWRKASLPQNEEDRLAAVHKLGLLDTGSEERFDRHARIAAAALDAPIVLVTLVDRERQWFKSHLGFDFSETPRDIGFCSHAILGDEPLVVTDALKDDRFAENPAVVGDPHVRFYAGVPLKVKDGSRVGALCIVDHKPRNLSASQLKMLQDIARLVEEELEAPEEAQKPKKASA
jgi:CheY-like chemotaxis protein